jgi:DNA modification methylase
MYKRTIKKELSFVGEPLVRERHKIHPYPAMLHPLLVNFLIKEFANKDDTIFDPFCGSGVTLVQAGINNHKAFGFDINPLALLIAKVKTAKYNTDNLLKDFEKFKKDLKSNKKIDIPEITNIDYWYSKEVKNDLGIIRYILKNKKYTYQDFFIVCFAFVCRNQSLTRNGEFKRYRMKEEKVKNTENKVFEKIINHIEAMINILKDSKNSTKKIIPILGNSEEKINSKLKYDLVITSPPYGDSRTTVAYGEYSSFGIEWTEDINSFGRIAYKVDKESIGKIGKINKEIYNNKTLIDTIEKIKKIDEKRSNDVLYFFNGYYNVLKNVVNNLNKNGKICFVVGNRTVKGEQIQMDQITAKFFEQLGLKFKNIFVRDILNKVMPSKNSPTNEVGVTKQTMANEYIVIFTK